MGTYRFDEEDRRRRQKLEGTHSAYSQARAYAAYAGGLRYEESEVVEE